MKLVLLLSILLLACQSETSPEFEQLHFGVTKGSALSVEGADPVVLDECVFINKDRIALVEVTGDLIEVSECSNGVGARYVPHYRIPVSEIQHAVGGTPVSTIISKISAKHGVPEKGEKLLVSTYREDGNDFVAALVYVSETPEFLESRANGGTLVDLPSTRTELFQLIQDATDSPLTYCTQKKLDQVFTKSSIVENYENDNRGDPCDFRHLPDDGVGGDDFPTEDSP